MLTRHQASYGNPEVSVTSLGMVRHRSERISRGGEKCKSEREQISARSWRTSSRSREEGDACHQSAGMIMKIRPGKCSAAAPATPGQLQRSQGPLLLAVP